MRRLDRRHLFLTLTLCAAVWLCRAELGLEAETLSPDAHLGALTAISAERRLVDAIVRDPFAGAPDGDAPALPTSPSASDAGTVGVRVPDIDTVAGNAAPATQLVVRAAIVGPNPVAYVDDGSGMQLVRIGDVVGGRNVSAIDLQGVAFADGTRLDLAPAPAHEDAPDLFRARPRARAARMVRAHRTSAAPPGAASTIPASPRTETATPSPAPELLYPTPGPLRTADARGLAPGVNPTPDFFDPTPFAYPYPYAPPH